MLDGLVGRVRLMVFWSEVREAVKVSLEGGKTGAPCGCAKYS